MIQVVRSTLEVDVNRAVMHGNSTCVDPHGEWDSARLSIFPMITIQSNPSIATTQDHGRAWSLWTGGLYIQGNYKGKTQGGRREQVVASTGNRDIQVVAKAGLTVFVFILN
jgi:hypothetical protein